MAAEQAAKQSGQATRSPRSEACRRTIPDEATLHRGMRVEQLPVVVEPAVRVAPVAPIKPTVRGCTDQQISRRLEGGIASRHKWFADWSRARSAHIAWEYSHNTSGRTSPGASASSVQCSGCAYIGTSSCELACVQLPRPSY
eukprot:3820414-Prymnesium_polylepis.3